MAQEHLAAANASMLCRVGPSSSAPRPRSPRLWAERGERRNAQDLLKRIYGWFTEGFDALDLQEAQALLSELGDHGLN
jgi:hypothetical protein